jgi:hypothetical protein
MVIKRQGDVLFIMVEKDKVPKGLKPRKSGVIAEGELTGHAHRVKNYQPDGGVTLLEAPDTATIQPGAEAPDMFLSVDTDHEVEIVHEEHGTITLEPNSSWVVRRQRQYEPEGNRRVQD